MPDLHDWDELEGDNFEDADSGDSCPAAPLDAVVRKKIDDPKELKETIWTKLRAAVGRKKDEKEWNTVDNPVIWDRVDGDDPEPEDNNRVM